MCGIFGWILQARAERDLSLLAELTDKLKHRGPDGGGYELLNIFNGKYQLGLGHRRLSILDLSGSGAQPMWSRDKSICVVYNGEIYNYVELREELIANGIEFHSSCDTEVLIAAYRAWGKDALKRFRGMFAFSLFDATTDTVILARDGFGKKPLFIYEKDGDYVFSSEIEPITAFPGFDRRFDWDALPDYLQDRFVPGPRTFFRAIKKLEPGCLAEWRRGKLTVERHYTPPLATIRPDITNFKEATELFTRTFEDAVRLRMRSDVEFGAFLSGGLDSSAIVSVMSRISPKPVRTFSVGFPQRDYSELDAAESVAKYFGTDHISLVHSEEDFFQNWDEAVLRRGAPVSEASDIPLFALSRIASKSVKVVLSGEGADEFLCGYPKHVVERFASLYCALVPMPVHSNISKWIVGRLPYGARRVKLLFRALEQRDASMRHRLWFGDMSPKQRDLLLGHCKIGVPASSDLSFSIPDASDLRRLQLLDQTSWLPDNTLERDDRMMMASGIEGRMPFMDSELAILAARMPDAFLARLFWSKGVLRSAMQGRVPDFVLHRKKVGFRVPLNEWLMTTRAELLRELLLSEKSETAQFLDRAALRGLVEDHVAKRTNNEKILWSLMNLEKFLRIYKPDMSQMP